MTGDNLDYSPFAQTFKQKDIRHLLSSIKQFLSNLPSNIFSAKLRDSLLNSALQLSRYHKMHYLKNNLAESFSFPAEVTKLILENCPEIDFQHFTLQWRTNQSSSNSSRPYSIDLSYLTRPLSGLPPICEISIKGDFSGLEKLLKYDASCVNATDNFGRTALIHCCYQATCDHMTCLELLLKYYANVDSFDNEGLSGLHWAAYVNNSDAMKSLLNAGATPLISDKLGRTPLHFAAQCKQPRVLQLLVQAGADSRRKDCLGMTPLLWACSADNLDALSALNVSHNVILMDMNNSMPDQSTDSMGRNAIHWAAISPHGNSCLGSLITLENSATCDTLGWTPLHYTAMLGLTQSCESILSNLPKLYINAKTKKGFIPLHIACYFGNGDVIDCLLSKGADSELKTCDNLTSLQIVDKLKLPYCQIVFETHQFSLLRSTPAKFNTSKARNLSNTTFLSNSSAPLRSPKPPTSPKPNKPRTPNRQHNRPASDQTQFRPQNVTQSLTINNDVTDIQPIIDSSKILRSRPISAKGRIRPSHGSKNTNKHNELNHQIDSNLCDSQQQQLHISPTSSVTSSPGPTSPLQSVANIDNISPGHSKIPVRVRQLKNKHAMQASNNKIKMTDQNGYYTVEQNHNERRLRKTLSFDRSLNNVHQDPNIELPPRPMAPTPPPIESDTDSVQISEVSSSVPIAPGPIEYHAHSGRSTFTPEVKKIAHTLGQIYPIPPPPQTNDVWDDSGFASPGKGIPKVLSTAIIPSPNRRSNVTPQSQSIDDVYLRQSTMPFKTHSINANFTSPYLQNVSLPNAAVKVRPRSQEIISPSQVLLTKRASSIPRYKPWKTSNDTLPSPQKPIVHLNRTDVNANRQEQY